MPLAEYMLALKDEIDNDPLGRGYSAMTDQEVADDLNTAYRTRNVQSFSGDFMFTQTDPSEFAGLSADKQKLWVSFTSKESVDPWATNNVEFVKWVFGDASTTLNNLGNARTESISRAQELGLLSGTRLEIGPAHVANARSI